MSLPRILNRHDTGDVLPPGSVYVGRPSRWGNPFSIQSHGTREAAIAAHRAWLWGQPGLLVDIRHELRGRDLVCWCAPKRCHAETLRAAANAPLRVISGGQTGVDQAGLRAARACGIATGGTAPAGWLTEDGPALGLADYGLVEHGAPGWRGRTQANVVGADATVLFGNLESPGSVLTERFARAAARPLARVRWPNDRPLDELVRELRIWIARGAFTTINVAGNRESVNFGIGAVAEDFFTRVFA